MKLDLYSNPIFQDQDIISLLYEGNIKSLDQLIVDNSPEISQLIEHAAIGLKTASSINYDKTVNDQDAENQAHWNIPREYRELDIIDYCLSLCISDTEQLRVAEELAEFDQRGMMPLLQVLKYLVDTFRTNNIVWGVGRGSSVSSYVLFLIGIHKIDSLKYNLDWREFLR